MGNQLLDTIDLIEEACAESALETMLALSDTYMKQVMILEAVIDPVDIGSFTVFQEASTVKEIKWQLGHTPIAGYKDESVVKRILMFIPRLIYHVLRFCIIVAGIVLGSIAGLIADGVSDLVTKKKREREQTEIIEVDFNPESIANFIRAYYEFIHFVEESSDTYDHYNRDMKYPIVKSIDTVMGYAEARKLKSALSSFDKEAYQTTEMSRDAAKNAEANLKWCITQLKFSQRKVQHEMKGMKIDVDSDVPQEYRKSIIEFSNLNAECGKKLSEFKAKMDELHKDIRTKDTLYKTQTQKASEKKTFDTFTENDLMDIMQDMAMRQAKKEKRIHGFLIFDPDNQNVKNNDKFKSNIIDKDKNLFRQNKQYPKQVCIVGYTQKSGNWSQVVRVIHCKEVDQLITSRFGDDGWFEYDA